MYISSDSAHAAQLPSGSAHAAKISSVDLHHTVASPNNRSLRVLLTAGGLCGAFHHCLTGTSLTGTVKHRRPFQIIVQCLSGIAARSLQQHVGAGPVPMFLCRRVRYSTDPLRLRSVFHRILANVFCFPQLPFKRFSMSSFFYVSVSPQVTSRFA